MIVSVSPCMMSSPTRSNPRSSAIANTLAMVMFRRARATTFPGSRSVAVTHGSFGPKQEKERRSPMSDQVEGRLLEVCTCGILCPCWVGEDPDGGTCDSALAWRIDNGNIEGIDVSG